MKRIVGRKIKDLGEELKITISLNIIRGLHSLHGFTYEQCIDMVLDPIKKELLKELKG